MSAWAWERSISVSHCAVQENKLLYPSLLGGVALRKLVRR